MDLLSAKFNHFLLFIAGCFYQHHYMVVTAYLFKHLSAELTTF